MMNGSNKKTADLRFFRFILFLLLITFFEESRITAISYAALIAMLLLPLVILLWFISYPQSITKVDRTIIFAFLAFILIQVVCIRWDNLYTSITPIYRSFAVLTVILYSKRFRLSTDKCRAISVLTVVCFLCGILTIFTPDETGSNILYGNYNTIGALFFTLCIINFIIYLKMHDAFSVLCCICCVLMIVLSNTRTALFLLLLILGLWLICCLLPKKIVCPKVFYPVLIVVIIGFVWFYYNIKELSIYSTLNEISKLIFNKNFDSGRPDLWHMTVEAVGNNWLFGCGTGVDLEDFFVEFKTPHSVYFDVYLQDGLMGVAFYLLCIFAVIKGKGKWKFSDKNIILMAVVVAILFYNSLGIIFTKPRSGIGLLQWALVALPYIFDEKQLKTLEIENDKLNSSGIQRKTVY